MIWTSRQSDYSKHDIMIVIRMEGAMLCEWPILILERWETSAAETSSKMKEYSFEEDTPDSVHTLVHSLTGHPRVCSLKREYPIDIRSPTYSDSDIIDLKQLWRPRICIITFALCILILVLMPVWIVTITSRQIMHIRTIWIISIAQNSSVVSHVHMKLQWNHECLIMCVHIYQRNLTVCLVMWNLLQN